MSNEFTVGPVQIQRYFHDGVVTTGDWDYNLDSIVISPSGYTPPSGGVPTFSGSQEYHVFDIIDYTPDASGATPTVALCAKNIILTEPTPVPCCTFGAGMYMDGSVMPEATVARAAELEKIGIKIRFT